MGNREKSINFEHELSLLKTQLEKLQVTVNCMQNDFEKKEKVLSKVSREKEQLRTDLKKQRRSNSSLKQQLEDERSFYYKEKEEYCNEMSRCKKINNKNSESTLKKEVAEISTTLNQTLEANYNLSVKFLRMKNTKLGLKKQLDKLKNVHDKSIAAYKSKFETLQIDLENLMKEQFIKPIPPSSKKYLQVIKQNGALIHENMELQVEIERLHFEIERMKMLEVKNDTNRKLTFIKNHKKHVKSVGIQSNPQIDKYPDSNIEEIFVRNKQVVDYSESNKNEVSKKSEITFDLATNSNSDISHTNESSLSFLTDAYRTQSAPEIGQTSI